MEICEELWRRKIDLCCLIEVRWGGVVEQSRKVGLNASHANNRSRWRLGVNTIFSVMRLIWPPPLICAAY